MNDLLKIAIIQTDIFWEDSRANLEKFLKLLTGMTLQPDLVVFPEMFTTGFSVNPELNAQEMTGESITWMIKLAGQLNSSMAGSLIIKDNSDYFNRFILVTPEGNVQHYDKRHLFRMEDEESSYQSGVERKIFRLGNWRICPQICYDLRFPVWSRNRNDYDLLIYVANWPKPRILAWDTLLKARAIENMCYCVGVNRVGVDKADNDYCGHSATYDILGSNITPLRPNKEHTEVVVLERNHINFYRNKLKFLADRDTFSLSK